MKKLRKLTVGAGKTTWECECPVCGGVFVCASSRLKSTKSCGCHVVLGKHGNVKHSPERASWLQLINQYKMNAKAKGLTWSLTTEEAIRLFTANCAFCGSAPYRSKQSVRKNANVPVLYNGIDRKDSTQGYVSANCHTCCTTCNYAKGTHTITEFDEWIKLLVKHRFDKDL